MFLFVVGLLVFAGCIIGLGFGKEQDKVTGRYITKWRFRPAQLASLLGVLMIAGSCITSVPTGHTGVVTTFGRVEDYTFEAGVHIRSPFQKVTNMDNRTQRKTLDLMAFSSDIQEVSVTFTLNYQISKENAQKIYRNVGVNYYDTVVEPRIQESVRAVIARYSAESLISQRSDLSSEIAKLLTDTLKQYNIVVLSTAVENMDFSDAFTDAVEAKQVAEQNKLKAEIEQAQATLEAEAAAERAIIAAEAEAEVTKIEAEVAKFAGEKEAEMNQKLAEIMTPELIEYYYTQKWDGKLPAYVAGGDSTTLPILDIGK